MVAAALGQGIGVSVVFLVDQLVVLAAIADPEAHGFQAAPDACIEGACAAQQVLQGVAVGVGHAVGQRVGAHDGLENVVATAVRGDVLPGVSQGVQHDAQDLLVVEVALRARRQQDAAVVGADFTLAQFLEQSLDLFLGFLQELLLGGDFLAKLRMQSSMESDPADFRAAMVFCETCSRRWAQVQRGSGRRCRSVRWSSSWMASPSSAAV